MLNKSYAYAETLEVLENMDEKYINKIPKSFIYMLKKDAVKNYKKHLQCSISLENQNLTKETINILALINYKYWTKNDEERNLLLSKYNRK